MASGLAVMSNLEREDYTRVFRRFNFVDECPVVSALPETLADRLRVLVTQPALRLQLGQACREFALKYHSYKTAQYLFGSIYENFFAGAQPHAAVRPAQVRVQLCKSGRPPADRQCPPRNGAKNDG